MRSKCCSIEIPIKGGAHMRSVDASIPDKSMYCLSAPPLTEVLCYSASNAVVQSKYATKIMFDFYTWLPHIWLVDWLIDWLNESKLIGWLIIDWSTDWILPFHRPIIDNHFDVHRRSHPPHPNHSSSDPAGCHLCSQASQKDHCVLRHPLPGEALLATWFPQEGECGGSSPSGPHGVSKS